jgi:putative transposase
MQIIKGLKYRIYPNKEQQVLINKTLGCSRFVYNHFLNVRSSFYKENGKGISYNKTSQLLTELKKIINWLNEVDSMALQESLKNLNTAFQNFLKKKSGYPNFKSKHDNNQSYRTRNQKNGIRIVGNYINLPKLGYVKIRLSRPVNGNILNATVRRTPTGKYFVSLCTEMQVELIENNGGQIGIDVGIKDFYSDSNGNVIANPKFLRKAEKKLIKEQRRLSRKQKGSNNRNKQRVKAAKAHENITNKRNDFLHKQSTQLVRENQTICIEDLKIKNMIKNHKLAKSIADVSWGRFFTMLEYKAVLFGTDIVRIPTFYPSSQTCCSCGYINKELKQLTIRKWKCPCCGSDHDRDSNASINILAKGLEIA